MFNYRLVACCLGLLALGERATIVAAEVAPPQVRRWIAELDHDDYQVREAATRRLIDSGRTVIDLVAHAALSDSPEVAWRAGDILQQIGVTGDEETVGLVVAAMQKLGDGGKHSFTRNGAELVQRWRQFRHNHAVAEIRRLGGEVVDMPGGVAMAGLGGMGGFGGGFIIGAPVGIDIDLPMVEEEPEPALDVAPDAERELGVVPYDALELPAFDPFDSPATEEPRDEEGDAQENKADGREDVQENGSAEASDDRVPGQAFAVPVPLDDVEAVAIPDAAEEPAQVEVLDERDEIADFDVDPAFAIDDVMDRMIAPVPAIFIGGGFVGWDAEGMPVQTAQMVRLGKAWRGTDDDLRLLADLNHLNRLQLDDLQITAAALKQIAALPELAQLQINNSQYDRRDVEQLRKARPNLNIIAFGKAVLGVSGQEYINGFQIQYVGPNTGAEKAGLIPGDIIQSVEGIPVRDFSSLTLAVADKKVGQTITLVVVRGGQTKQLAATLGSREELPGQ